MCTLHDFLGSKVRFIHKSTVTRSHSCYEKKTTRTPRVLLVSFRKRIIKSDNSLVHGIVNSASPLFSKIWAWWSDILIHIKCTYVLGLSPFFSSFFFFSKKLPIVVVRDVCPSVVCVNIFYSR